MIAVYAALVALATLLGLVPASDAAPLATYYHAGAWDAFSGRNDDGSLVCGIGNTNPADDRKFTLRFTVGEDPVVFTVTKPTWAIPSNTPVSVVMQLGLDRPWTEQATGSAQSVTWSLGRTDLQLFDTQFRRATSMTLAFPDGREPPMLIPLAGSTAISDALRRCISDFSRISQSGLPPPPVMQAPTQPFSPAVAPPPPGQTPSPGPAAPPPVTPGPDATSPAPPASNPGTPR